jgi:hypothetical protein
VKQRTLLLIVVTALVAWFCLRGNTSSAQLYGMGAQPVPGGLYGGGQ